MNKEAGQMTDRMQGKDAAKRLSILTTAGLIFLMLLYLLLTSYSSTLLAQHTEAISSHPFEVIISAGDVKTYLSEMQIRAERLTKYNSWTDIRLVRNSLDDLYEKIQGPLAIMEAQYLGDPNDVKEIKATLAQLQEELDACVSLASKGTAPELSDYEERRLNPLFGRAEELVDHVIDAAKERKLQYGQTAERLRKQTLIGSVVLVTLMIGGLLLSQYVLRSQRQELLRRSLLFDNLSMNIDDAFLIRDAVTGKVSYTALNIERVLSRPVKRLEDVYEGFLPVDAEQIRRAIADPKFISPYIKNVPYTLTNGEQRWLSVRIYRAKGLEATQIISVFPTAPRKSNRARRCRTR